jgi:hypothetical protein
MIPGKFDVGKWETWFAWRPVRLLGGARFAWLRRISRRHVITERNTLKRDYSDVPEDHPLGYGLHTHDINAGAPLAPKGTSRRYRGYDMELKSMTVGWQVTTTKNDVFVRHSGVSEDLDEVITETHAFIDGLSREFQDGDG